MKLDLIKDSNGIHQILINDTPKDIIYPYPNENPNDTQQRAIRKYESLLMLYMNNKHIVKKKDINEIQVLKSITF